MLLRMDLFFWKDPHLFQRLHICPKGCPLAGLWALVRSRTRAHWGTWTYPLFVGAERVVRAERVALVYFGAHGLLGHRFWT